MIDAFPFLFFQNKKVHILKNNVCFCWILFLKISSWHFGFFFEHSKKLSVPPNAIQCIVAFLLGCVSIACIRVVGNHSNYYRKISFHNSILFNQICAFSNIASNHFWKWFFCKSFIGIYVLKYELSNKLFEYETK